MKPHTKTPRDDATDTEAISPTDLFAAFAAARRRDTLSYLAQKPAAIHLGDLAEYIAVAEGEPSYDWYQRILVDLHHRHLPHLRDAGLVHYEADSELVDLAVDRDVIAPYLELVADGEQ
ncbi:DUF7344 domain-containing protein [Halosolutus gelatinilyticus]|uniref:DUF7344 domain-containing protein n=1 Tax=Halosolutus gelatinilyticus TaxID=2931975 RepID=UPI001FF102FF|nr:hypothetical protein [Halosolutus gelatinilyticus]